MTDRVSAAEDLAHEAAELALVHRVDRSLRRATERLAQTTNVRGVIIDLLRECSTIVDSREVIQCGLLLYDPVSRLLRFEAMFANGVETNLEGTALQGPFPVDSEALALPWQRIEQEPWLWGLTDDASILATTVREYHESTGARSVAYLPLRRDRACIGFVGFSLRSAHPPTRQQVHLLQRVGFQVALAVEIQHLATAIEQASAARERQRLAELRSNELTKANLALQATIDAVTSMQSLDDFMPRVVAIVAQAFEAIGAGYFEHPEETIHHRFWLENGHLLAATELPGLDPVHLPVLKLLAGGFSVPPDHLGVEFRRRLRPSIVHHRMATASPGMHAFAVSRGWDWELNIPLFANERTEAAITFFRHEDHPFTEADIPLAESLAKQISLARQVSRVGEREREVVVAREREAAALSRARELERASTALQATIDAVSELASLDAFIPQALRIVVNAFAAQSAAYWERTADTVYLRHWLVDGQVFGPTEIPGLASTHGFLAQLARGFTVSPDHVGPDFRHRTRPSVIHHRSATASPALHSFARSMGWDWELNVPLLVAGVADAALTLYRGDADPFTDGDFSLAEAVAKQISLGMRIGRVAEREREITVARERGKIAEQRAVDLARSNAALQSTIDVLTTVESLTEFVPSVLRLVSVAFDCAACAYYEHLAGEPIFLRYWLWHGEILGPEEMQRASMDGDRGFLRALARGFHLPGNYTGDRSRGGHTPVLIDHEAICDEESAIDRFYRVRGLSLELRVPLIVGGSSDGALVMRRSSSQPFSESEVALAANLGRQLALAAQSHRLAERARIDSLARAQEQAVVRERERMSRDIHDTLAQGYAAILVNSQALKLSLRSELPPGVLSGIEMFERLAKENLTHARRTMADLRADPFGRTALAVTLQQCATDESQPGVFSVAVDVPAEDLWVPRYVEVELRRIVKEALSNARRHARTNFATVKLSVGERRCTIRIIDRGTGFDCEKVRGSFGIQGMRERAERAGAEFAIETSPGHGTIISMGIDMEFAGDGTQR